MQALAKSDDQIDNLWLPCEAKPERDRILCWRPLDELLSDPSDHARPSALHLHVPGVPRR